MFLKCFPKVRFIGKPDFSEEELVGIELDSWSPNAGDGSICGQHLFETSAGKGFFTHSRFVTNIMCRSTMKRGAYARLKGFTAAPWLNGERVKVIAYKQMKGVWKVKPCRIYSNMKKYLRVKAENLEVIIDWKRINKANREQQESPKEEPKVGDRVRTRSGRIGTVKYVGAVEFANGDIDRRIGLSLDQRHPNGHNGTVNGRKYFAVKAEGRGYFVTLDDLIENMGPKKISKKTMVKRRLHRARGKLRHIEMLEIKQECGVRLNSKDIDMMDRKEELKVKVKNLMKKFPINSRTTAQSPRDDEAKSEFDDEAKDEHIDDDDDYEKQYNIEQLTAMCQIDPVDVKLSRMERVVKLVKDIDISNYVFMARSGGHETEEYRFKNLSEFQIPCQSQFELMTVPRSVNIYVKSNESDGVSDFVQIKSMMKSRYVFDQEASLHINESIIIPLESSKRRNSGNLNIQCSSDIVIGPNVTINGTNAELNGKGSSLMLMSSANVTNQGIVCCDDIFIVAVSFVNYGDISRPPTILLVRNAKPSASDLESDDKWIFPLIKTLRTGYNNNLDLMLRSGAFGYLVTFGHCGLVKMVHQYLLNWKSEQEVNDMMNGRYDGNGCTPLHFACMGGYEDIARYLVDVAKVDIFRKDKMNKTAMEYAIENGYHSIAQWILVDRTIEISDFRAKQVMERFSTTNDDSRVALLTFLRGLFCCELSFDEQQNVILKAMSYLKARSGMTSAEFRRFLQKKDKKHQITAAKQEVKEQKEENVLAQTNNEEKQHIACESEEVNLGVILRLLPNLIVNNDAYGCCSDAGLQIKVEDRIRLFNGRTGIVRWKGTVPRKRTSSKFNDESDNVQHFGIELDVPDSDAHDGKQYFHCAENRGVLVTLTEIEENLGVPSAKTDQQIHFILKKQRSVLKINDRVELLFGGRGTVRYLGNPDFVDDLMFGIELDHQSLNASNGTVNGIQYFDCEHGKGLFVGEESIVEQLAERALPRLERIPRMHDKVQLIDGQSGVVKFVGQLDSSADTVIGVNLDHWSPNGNNGSISGKTYFQCKLGHGHFVGMEHIAHNMGSIISTPIAHTVCIYFTLFSMYIQHVRLDPFT